MKKMKTLLVALAIFAGATSFMNAQSKVAHIDAQALIESMPEYKAAQTSLEKIQRSYETEIKAMMKELDTKAKQYDAEASSKTDAENQKRFEPARGPSGSGGGLPARPSPRAGWRRRRSPRAASSPG